MRRRGQGRPPVDFKARDSDPIFRLRSDPNFHKCQIRSTDSGQIRGRGLGLFSPVHGKFINFEFKVYGSFQVLGKYNYRNEGGVRLAKYIKTLGIKVRNCGLFFCTFSIYIILIKNQPKIIGKISNYKDFIIFITVNKLYKSIMKL